MGARIAAADGRPPLTIDGGDLHGIAHTPPVPSAQVKSGVLLAGLHAAGVTRVHEPAPTRDHTEQALTAFGVRIDPSAPAAAAAPSEGRQRPPARRLRVPGDLSSATFWAVLAASVPGAAIEIDRVGLNGTRTGVLDVLGRTGARVDWTVEDQDAGEPIG